MKLGSGPRSRRESRRALRRATWIGSLVLAGLAPSAVLASAGGGGGGVIGGGGGSSGPAQRSPDELAAKAYEKGQRARDRALAYEAEAEQKDEPGFLGIGKRPSEKAADQWLDAVAAYREAVANKADFYQAYGDLGYAYRKLGNYTQSLAAYDQALRIQSDYAPAIEYRGEAYLKLGRLDDAKDAYGQLFRSDRSQADQLMGAMREWLDEAESKPVDGVSPEELKAFREWVEQRGQLASQVSGNVSHIRGW